MGKLSKKSLGTLVDDGGEFDSLIKASANELDFIKTTLKNFAQDNEARLLEGNKKYDAKIGAISDSKTELMKVYKDLAKHDIRKFLLFVKPDVKAIREHCDAAGVNVNDYIKTYKNMFGSISFKKKPKKTRVRRRR